MEVEKLISFLENQQIKELNEFLPTIQDLTVEEAQPFLTNEKLYNTLVAHWRWDNSGSAEDPVCKLFYNWYQLELTPVKIFILNFLPEILWNYLFKNSHGVQLLGIEAILVCIYNQVVITGKQKSFVCPTTSISSILHNRVISKTEDYEREEELNVRVINQPKLKMIGKDSSNGYITMGAGARIPVIDTCLSLYAQNYTKLHKNSQSSFLKFVRCVIGFSVKNVSYGPKIEQPNYYLVKLEEGEESDNSVKEFTNRFHWKIKQNLAVPCKWKIWTEKPIFISNTSITSILTIIAYRLAANKSKSVQSDSVQRTLELINHRASIEIDAEIMLLTNALLHRFSIK